MTLPMAPAKKSIGGLAALILTGVCLLYPSFQKRERGVTNVVPFDG